MKLIYGLLWGIIIQLALTNFILSVTLAETGHTNRLLQQTNSRLHDIDMSLFRLGLK